MEPGGEREPVTICGYESRYDQILETALNEYADVPCSDYYRDGYNLRFIKRKQNPAVSLRSIKSLELLCDSMSVLFLMRKEGGSLYDKVSTVFG
ncbi:MAG: hypothetical protein KH199_23535 [Enterocloster clostridioformis]|uniref:hypothetical protein n=1 Tax=Enterocloster clostridioformis TaxID=1531 RepID=UPI001DCFF550|nr:hypothetical protein [Enterocloster clostridioformis]MBS7006586.1 hypothetical protein [Enterocloster clostridioformis]